MNIKTKAVNIILLILLSAIFSGCAATINYKSSKLHGQSNGSLLYEHKAVNGEDIHTAIVTTESYELYLGLTNNKALYYTFKQGVLYLGMSEGQKDIEKAKSNADKICKQLI